MPPLNQVPLAPRGLLAAGVAFVALLGFAPNALAATLSISAPDQESTAPLEVNASGTADVASTIFVYGERGGTSCGASPSAHSTSGRTISVQMQKDVPAGEFAEKLTKSAGTGEYRLCAYLKRPTLNAPDATATTTVRYRAPVCPSAAFTITGTQDRDSSSKSVTLEVPGQGSLAFRGDGGGSTYAQAPSQGSLTVTVYAGSATQQKLNSGQAASETFTVTFTRNLPSDCRTADGTETRTVSENRTVTLTFQPPPPSGGTTTPPPAGSPPPQSAPGPAPQQSNPPPPQAVIRPTPPPNGSADAAAGRYFRALYYESLDFFVNGIGGWGALCFPNNDCVPSATLKVTINAATRRKLKLPSTTIATGVTKKNGEAYTLRPAFSTKVKARLKKLIQRGKLKRLKVTFVITVAAPGQPGVLSRTVVLTTKPKHRVIIDGLKADGSPGTPAGGGGRD